MTQIVLVGLGGFLGSVFRFSLYHFFSNQIFPLSTLTVNLLGSLLIGLVLPSQLIKFHPTIYYTLVAGVLGGFTTYSAFSGETVSLLLKNEIRSAIIYLLLTVLGGLICCLIGFLIGKTFWS